MFGSIDLQVLMIFIACTGLLTNDHAAGPLAQCGLRLPLSLHVHTHVPFTCPFALAHSHTRASDTIDVAVRTITCMCSMLHATAICCPRSFNKERMIALFGSLENFTQLAGIGKKRGDADQILKDLGEMDKVSMAELLGQIGKAVAEEEIDIGRFKGFLKDMPGSVESQAAPMLQQAHTTGSVAAEKMPPIG